MRGSSSRLQSPASSLLQIPIEDVPLGARIATKNPRPWEYDDSLPEPDEATWAKLSITVERTDGGVVDAELLRPRSWIEAHGIRAGERLPLNIPELDVAGLATVTAVEACPELSQAEGSAVTGRFVTRQIDAIARIEVRGADGTSDILEGTTIHPIWSLDRHDWVPLGELQEGEQLLGHAGPVEVLSHIILHRTTPVYNIEVHGEHVYEVGAIGLLVHNTYPVNKALNTNIVHAADRTMQRMPGAFPDVSAAREALKELSKDITQNGFPKGAIRDPLRSDSVLVPFGNGGHAVYELAKNLTAHLRTVLGP